MQLTKRLRKIGILYVAIEFKMFLLFKKYSNVKILINIILTRIIYDIILLLGQELCNKFHIIA